MGEFSGLIPGLGILETGINAGLQSIQNAKNRQFAREQYKTQRRDALADWNMQNAYDSPRAQMQRFQEANLNPHLIYGSMSNSPAVRSSNASQVNGEAPQVDVTSKFMQGYNLERTSAQTDLLNKQLEVEDARINMMRVQAIAAIVGTGKTKAETDSLLFDLGLKKDLRETTIEGKKAEVQKLNTDIFTSLDANDRANVMQAPTVAKAVEEILTLRMNRSKTELEKSEIRQKIGLLKKENIIKQYDVNLTKQGIRPGDPVWHRMIMQLMNALGIGTAGTPGREPGDDPADREYRRRHSIGKHE